MLGELSLAGVLGEPSALSGRVVLAADSCFACRVGSLLMRLLASAVEERYCWKYWAEGGEEPPSVEGVHGKGD